MIEILPLDIFALIFLAIYHHDANPFPPNEAVKLEEFHNHRLLDVMLVCRAWKDLIDLNTPALLDVCLEGISVSSSQGSAELERVVEIHSTRSHVRKTLAALGTPSLQTLAVERPWDGGDADTDDEAEGVDPNPHPSLTTYHDLKELHWEGGEESHGTLEHLLSKSPTLERFSEYVQVPLDSSSPAPSTIPRLIVSRNLLSSTDHLCSVLEEVCFDAATCSDVEHLVTLRPSIKRVRFLRDPRSELTENPSLDSNLELEKQVFERLKERVDVAIGTEPWRGGGEQT
ncbi:hypothetical protein M407DRAFT_28928 [Tulasnella calospora MUT 4182]|uniref:F-box domain-containing protein n=1 Tax=Tulasnella calospora MUT 4182 TaxID=1051891 RepID=A0A0C3KJ43_9AGAM|nr:hypothetical protein M407DRAFT_28928 [Tulasnella calospora MUT 4182]